jgi:AcrR family transcriptional regulator
MTTIEQLCVEAGVTARHFYEEFSTREALLLALFDELAEHVLGRVREAIYAPGKPVSDLIRNGVRAYFEDVTHDPRRARIIVMEAVGVSPFLERHRRAMVAGFVRETIQSMRPLAQRRFASALDIELLFTALVGAGQQLTVEWVLADRKRPVRRLATVLASMWLRCLEIESLQVPVPRGTETR